jgi:hypothetical protein
MPAKEKGFYVGISNPIDVRRNLLETSKDIIQILKRYESLHRIKEEKRAEMNKFRSTVSEITQLMLRLKTSLPPVRIEDLPRREVTETTTRKPIAPMAVKRAKVSQESAAPGSELDRLEQELGKIEDKLKSL